MDARSLGLEEQALPRTVLPECSTPVLGDTILRPEGQGLGPHAEESRSRHAGPMVSMGRSDFRKLPVVLVIQRDETLASCMPMDAMLAPFQKRHA